MIVIHKKKRKTEYESYCRISLFSHAGNVHLKVNAKRLGEYCERNGLLPGKQSGFRPFRSTWLWFDECRN